MSSEVTPVEQLQRPATYRWAWRQLGVLGHAAQKLHTVWLLNRITAAKSGTSAQVCLQYTVFEMTVVERGASSESEEYSQAGTAANILRRFDRAPLGAHRKSDLSSLLPGTFEGGQPRLDAQPERLCAVSVASEARGPRPEDEEDGEQEPARLLGENRHVRHRRSSSQVVRDVVWDRVRAGVVLERTSSRGRGDPERPRRSGATHAGSPARLISSESRRWSRSSPPSRKAPKRPAARASIALQDFSGSCPADSCFSPARGLS